MHIVIFRVKTKATIQQYITKNLIKEIKWNSKILLITNPKEVREGELKIQRRFTQDYCNTGGRMNFIGIKKKKTKKQEWFLTWGELVD